MDETNLEAPTGRSVGERAHAKLTAVAVASVSSSTVFRPMASLNPPKIGEMTISAAAEVDEMAVRTAMPRFWPSSEMKCVVGVRVTSERPSTNMKAVTCSGTSGRSTLGARTSAAATSGAACVLDAATLLILVECAGRACPSPAESRLGENARAASSKSVMSLADSEIDEST